MGDASDNGGLFHKVGRAVMQQAEGVVDTCVEAARSAFHTLKGSSNKVVTAAVTLLQNVNTDMKTKFSKLFRYSDAPAGVFCHTTCDDKQ